MTKKFRQLSLQAKMSSIFILVNLVVFAVTVILILGINRNRYGLSGESAAE